jgi:predicted HicB family RNase H-like nuclease
MSKKDLNYYKSLQYNVIVEKQEFENEIWYIAYANELGKFACYGRGNTEIEALKCFLEEKENFIEFLFNSKKTIPEPRINENDRFSGTFNVRTSSIIHSELVNQAKELNISLNLYLNQILSRATENKRIDMLLDDKLKEISNKIDNHHFEITKQMKYQNDSLFTRLKWRAEYSKDQYLQTA